MSFESWSDIELTKILRSLAETKYGIELKFPLPEDMSRCKDKINRLRKKLKEELVPFTIRPNPQDKYSFWLVRVTETSVGEFDEKE